MVPFFLLPFICPVLFAHQSQTVLCSVNVTVLAGSQLWTSFGIWPVPRLLPLLHVAWVKNCRLLSKYHVHVKAARRMLPFGLGSAHLSQVTAPLRDKRLLLKDNKVPPSAKLRPLTASCGSNYKPLSPSKSSSFPIPLAVAMKSGSSNMGYELPDDAQS